MSFRSSVSIFARRHPPAPLHGNLSPATTWIWRPSIPLSPFWSGSAVVCSLVFGHVMIMGWSEVFHWMDWLHMRLMWSWRSLWERGFQRGNDLWTVEFSLQCSFIGACISNSWVLSSEAVGSCNLLKQGIVYCSSAATQTKDLWCSTPVFQHEPFFGRVYVKHVMHHNNVPRHQSDC